MSRSNLLTISMNKVEPFFKLGWLPANLPTLVAVGVILTASVVGLQKFQETKAPETKSMAWYMANPKLALAQNKECFDNPKLKDTENCVYSLHALEIMHKGPNS